jgi:hypothetical protein
MQDRKSFTLVELLPPASNHILLPAFSETLDILPPGSPTWDHMYLRNNGGTVVYHPIHSCPPELLQLIFEECTSEAPYKNSSSTKTLLPATACTVPRTAITLASVNQLWRRLALSTPFLWTFIDIRLDRHPLDIQQYWGCIIERIKDFPKWITLREGKVLEHTRDLSKPDDYSLLSPRSRARRDRIQWPDPPDVARQRLQAALSVIEFDQIPRISELAIVFTHGEYLDALLSPTFKPPSRSFSDLVIRALLRPINEAGDPAPPHHLNLKNVVARFSQAGSVTLDHLPKFVDTSRAYDVYRFVGCTRLASFSFFSSVQIYPIFCSQGGCFASGFSCLWRVDHYASFETAPHWLVQRSLMAHKAFLPATA